MTSDPLAVDPPASPTAARREVAVAFLRLGFTAFGGPAAHLALMEEQFVRRRRWLTREKFLDLLGAANLLPGPNSTEMALFLGYHRAGWAGLLLAGAGFILPATGMVAAIAWAYVAYGTRLSDCGILYGMKPVIIAVVAQALWNLGRTALRTPLALIAAAAVAVLALTQTHELRGLLGAGVAVALLRTLARGRNPAGPALVAPGASASLAGGTTVAAAVLPVGLGTLFFTFLKVGALLYGSGYVLLAFLRADLVERGGYLSEEQLLDAVAVGQVTPGPVFTTATFIGYVLRAGEGVGSGMVGALVATAGIFLPAFFYVALSRPLVAWLRRSRMAGDFLDGVNAAALALMAVVTWRLGCNAIVDVPTALLTAAGVVLLLGFGVRSTWLMLAGALVGLVVRQAGWA